MSDKKKCGAKKRDGSPCQAWGSIKNGRCRLHGGTNNGPPKGNRNSVKHGIYSQFFSGDEKTLLDRSKLDDLNDEIGLVRVMIQRTLKAQAESNNKPELVELTVDGIPNPDDPDAQKKALASAERKYKAIDYDQKLDRLTGRLTNLLQTRANLEIASLEIDKRQRENRIAASMEGGDTPTPVQVVINVQDARKPDAEPNTEYTTGEVPSS